MNLYSYGVDEWEILEEERVKPFGERLTKFNCLSQHNGPPGCGKPLSEADLFSIRLSHAPCMHYECCFPKS